MANESRSQSEMSAHNHRTDLVKHHRAVGPKTTRSPFTGTSALIYDYAPRMVTPNWVDIEDFTFASVADMAEPRKKSDHKQYLAVVSGLAHWATGYGSLSLDRAEIFHPDTISDYMQTMRADVGHDIYNRRLWLLRQMSETLVHAKPNEVPPPGYGLGTIAAFSPAAFDGLAEWADRLSAPGRRRDAEATLALCGGAGLTHAELFHARAQDLVFRDDGVFIFVPGENPRSVPVHSLWEDRVRARYANTHPLAHLVRPHVSRRRQVRTWVIPGTRSVVADDAELSARLRATWLERGEDLLPPVAANHFAGYPVTGGPAAARELMNTIDLETSAAILRGAGGGW